MPIVAPKQAAYVKNVAGLRKEFENLLVLIKTIMISLIKAATNRNPINSDGRYPLSATIPEIRDKMIPPPKVE